MKWKKQKNKFSSFAQYALVTGADSGIGLAFANELARHNVNLVLVSNHKEELKNISEKIQEEFDVLVLYFYQDLSLPNAAQKVFDFCQTKNIQIDLLINNAGVFFFSELVKTNLQTIQKMIDLHIKTVTEMCRLFGGQMINRKSGFILNMSSMAAWMPMPGIHIYNATKAYLRNFSRSIYYEMKRYNVGVTVVCPGGIDTQLFGLPQKQRKLGRRLGILMSPQKLAKKALQKTFAFKQQTVQGAINYFFILIVLSLPRWFIFWAMNFFPQFKKNGKNSQ